MHPGPVFGVQAASEGGADSLMGVMSCPLLPALLPPAQEGGHGNETAETVPGPAPPSGTNPPSWRGAEPRSIPYRTQEHPLLLTHPRHAEFCSHQGRSPRWYLQLLLESFGGLKHPPCSCQTLPKSAPIPPTGLRFLEGAAQSRRRRPGGPGGPGEEPWGQPLVPPCHLSRATCPGSLGQGGSKKLRF